VMEQNTYKMSISVACKKFFGQKEGQTLMQFAEEVRKLTPQDKVEMAGMLSTELGVEVAS